MESFYLPLTERDYRKEALRWIKTFGAEMDLPIRNRFEHTLSANAPTDDKTLFQDFVGKATIPSLSKENYIHALKTALKFVETHQAIQLLQCEIWEAFDALIVESYKSIPDRANWFIDLMGKSSRNTHTVIEVDEAFERFFTAYIKNIMALFVEGLPAEFEKYRISEENFKEILEVEKYILLEKMICLYDDYQQDIRSILLQIPDVKDSLRYVHYRMPYFNLDFHIAEIARNKDSSRLQINIHAIQKIHIPNPLPAPVGTYQRFLEIRLNEAHEEVKTHKNEAQAQLTVAKHDLQSVIDTYNKGNKFTKNIKLSFDSKMQAGEMQMRIETSVFWRHSMAGQTWQVVSFLGFMGTLFLCLKGAFWAFPLFLVCAFAFFWGLWKSYF